MAVIFAVRGTQTKPWYSKGSSEFCTVKNSSGAADTSIQSLADSSVFGGSALRFNVARSEPRWFAGQNWAPSTAFSVVVRFVPQWTGAPAALYDIFRAGELSIAACYLRLSVTTGSKVKIEFYNQRSVAILDTTGANSLTFAAGVANEIMFESDGTGSANSCRLYVNGVLNESFSPASAANSVPWNNMVSSYIALSNCQGGATLLDINEILIFDAPIGAYSARTDFWNVAAANGDTVPAASNVRSGVATGLNTGTVVVPSLADTKTGVAGDGGTGTYDGSDRWTDPGQANVRLATAYKANSTSNNRTGTMVAAAAATTKVGVTADDGTGSYNGSDRWTDLSEDTVKLGVAYKANSTSNNKTGSYTGSDLYDTVPEEKVELGYEYLANGVTLEGSMPRVLNTFTGAKLRGNRNE